MAPPGVDLNGGYSLSDTFTDQNKRPSIFSDHDYLSHRTFGYNMIYLQNKIHKLTNNNSTFLPMDSDLKKKLRGAEQDNKTLLQVDIVPQLDANLNLTMDDASIYEEPMDEFFDDVGKVDVVYDYDVIWGDTDDEMVGYENTKQTKSEFLRELDDLDLTTTDSHVELRECFENLSVPAPISPLYSDFCDSFIFSNQAHTDHKEEKEQFMTCLGLTSTESTNNESRIVHSNRPSLCIPGLSSLEDSSTTKTNPCHVPTKSCSPSNQTFTLPPHYSSANSHTVQLSPSNSSRHLSINYVNMTDLDSSRDFFDFDVSNSLLKEVTSNDQDDFLEWLMTEDILGGDSTNMSRVDNSAETLSFTNDMSPCYDNVSLKSEHKSFSSDHNYCQASKSTNTESLTHFAKHQNNELSEIFSYDFVVPSPLSPLSSSPAPSPTSQTDKEFSKGISEGQFAMLSIFSDDVFPSLFSDIPDARLI